MQMLSQPCTGVSGSGTITSDTAAQAAYYTAATTVAGSTGIIYSATDILSESHEITAVSASATVSAIQGVF